MCVLMTRSLYRYYFIILIIVVWWSYSGCVVSGFFRGENLVQRPCRLHNFGDSSIARGGRACEVWYHPPLHRRRHKFWFRFLASNRDASGQNEDNEESSSVLSTNSSFPTNWPSTSSSISVEQRQQQQHQETTLRLIRSASVVVGCCLTWGLTQLHTHGGGTFGIAITRRLSLIQASALTGILGCVLTSTKLLVGFQNNPSIAAAIFCGSFAGMSSLIQNLSSSIMMGTMTGIVYYVWDAYKIGVGVGGRLGAMALLSNLLLLLGTKITTTAGWSTPADGNLILGIAVDYWKQLVGLKTVGPLAVLFPLLLLPQRPSADSSPNPVGQQRYSNNNKMIHIRTMVKSLTMGIIIMLFRATTGTNNISIGFLALTFAVVYTSTLGIQEASGVVLPVAILGLIGGSLFPPHIAAGLYMGGFIGMTKKTNFNSWQAAQASLIASLALCGGFWTGLGGRLGTQAFIGVLFSLS